MTAPFDEGKRADDGRVLLRLTCPRATRCWPNCAFVDFLVEKGGSWSGSLSANVCSSLGERFSFALRCFVSFAW